MDCTNAWDLLSAYLDGDLPEREREGIADHLRRCPRCAEEERALKETLSLLRDLPAGPAPPELLRGITLRLEEETSRTPLWRKLFLPAHIKIPLEVAAVALIFVLVYGIQREIPAKKTPPAPPASVERGIPEKAGGTRADRPETEIPRKRRADAEGRGTEEIRMRTDTEGGPSPESERASVAKSLRENTTSTPNAGLPAIPATRVSTSGEPIGSPSPRETPGREAPAPRAFAAPPSYFPRSMPYGREVTIEVAPDARAGMENRIAEIALRLGGAFLIEKRRGAPGAFGEAQPPSDLVQVHLPAGSADLFLKELGTFGTIPFEDTTERDDLFAGPSTGSVVYTVRIRVR